MILWCLRFLITNCIQLPLAPMVRNYPLLKFLLAYLFSITFLYHFISFHCIYRVRVHKSIPSYGNNSLCMPTASVEEWLSCSPRVRHIGEFEPRFGKTNDYEIVISCFFAKYTALKRKNKDWLDQNQDNVSEWGDMSIRGLLFQWASTIKKPTDRVGLIQSGRHHHLIEN